MLATMRRRRGAEQSHLKYKWEQRTIFLARKPEDQLTPNPNQMEVELMPITKEFTIHMEDRPGTMAKLLRSLADRGVNIVAVACVPEEKGKSIGRLVTDNPTMTKTVFDSERTPYTETEVVQIKLPHRPGALASAAEKLAEKNINIDYTYGGVEKGAIAPFLIFGVADVKQAAKILEEAAFAAA